MFLVEMAKLFTRALPEYAKEMALALLPIAVFFALFQIVSLRLERKTLLRIGVGVSAFERRFALRRAETDGLPAKGRRRGRKVGRLLWRSAKRLRGARIRLQGRLDLGDAAATATACGALRAVVYLIIPQAGASVQTAILLRRRIRVAFPGRYCIIGLEKRKLL